MKRMRMSALGALAVPLAMAAVAMTSGPAAASTAHARIAEVTRVTASVNTAAVSCDPSGGPCEYDSGWVTYGDGGCELSTTVYFDPVTNSMDVWVWIQSPYLFASCTGYSTVYFGMTSGPPVHTASFRAFACSTSDLSCSSFDYSYYGDQLTGIPAGSDYGVDSIWVSNAS